MPQQPQQPQQMPPQQYPQPPAEDPDDVEAILRGAADNLSGEMFDDPNNPNPRRKDDNNQH